jgi:Uma2 family endonuclease
MGMSAIEVSVPERGVWTVEDVWALPSRDGYRYEVLHGELLVTAMPTLPHQRAATVCTALLYAWARPLSTYSVFSPGGVFISDTTWLEPDVSVFPLPLDSSETDWRKLSAPVLVVEVLSPSTRKRDRHRKRPAYLAHGVGEVWIVDADRRLVERWTAASEFPVVVTDQMVWSPTADVAPLEFELAELFGGPR